MLKTGEEMNKSRNTAETNAGGLEKLQGMEGDDDRGKQEEKRKEKKAHTSKHHKKH